MGRPKKFVESDGKLLKLAAADIAFVGGLLEDTARVTKAELDEVEKSLILALKIIRKLERTP